MVLVLPTEGPLGDGDNMLQKLLQDPLLLEANANFLAQKDSKALAASCRAISTCVDALRRAAHYNSGFANTDSSILELLPHHMEKPDVWLVGSFQEPNGESEATLFGVLRQLQDSHLPFHVRLACVDSANTNAKGGPYALNLTVRCSPTANAEGAIAKPMGFEDRGPELPRRFAYDHLAADGQCLQNIVDTATSRFRVPGFRCRWLPRHHIEYYAAQIRMPDAAFLQKNSTSPDYEPPSFVQDVKDAYRYIIQLATQGVTSVSDAWFEWVGSGPQDLTGSVNPVTSSGRWAPVTVT
ncbi:hypothetical protein VOLCADRAFT_103207 [Volvox carteri f. nagariensis]|uniref:Uncharacterized protein n=1 Tax=Volvox carteri f. nagariensis TaxID=3068 RepID=D8TK61_VOLCA|nr:uncharacterized protein VOLCADRAFT_103207 [Volvox carteri f. nagariensis]EFJ52005.1 hypothetical protein VOLCADRAFT_103207 [Volvox carteri f. nagariensis]|eukprot:XP_002946779.1 hypothetical protein VOLCADRAFT_103207 [Volvox carteri f. nagariensis]